jgi:hypothetical protein
MGNSMSESVITIKNKKEVNNMSTSTTPTTSAVADNSWMEDLVHNNPKSAPESVIQTILGEFCNKHGLTNDKSTQLNICIAASAMQTSNESSYAINFKSKVVSVSELAKVCNIHKLTLRQFMRANYRFYEEHWSSASALIISLGGCDPAYVDWRESTDFSTVDRLQKKEVVQALKQVAHMQPGRTQPNVNNVIV